MSHQVPFHLRVVEARGLYAGPTTVADPYIKCKLKGLKHIFNSEKQVTDVKKNTENPVFMDDFVLHPKITDTILIKIYDRNTLKDKRLGTILIPTEQYLNRGIVDAWFPIDTKTPIHSAQIKPEVHLLINFGTAAAAFARDYQSQGYPHTAL
eukprot:TRINITY_DN9708_c0_g1_i1.p1 TRINITY_DN9708_c0_g1~~TRINITY_DN9708_c0_g1_i1.p1  ORF type:complete len:160 (+),score=41.66 TRINITY_DN9708_c0_g1_i1:25-480(+)